MRILFLISALLLASCSADQQNNNTSTDVSVSLGQSVASGAISSGIPANVQSVTLEVLAANGTVIAGPLVANRPNFTLKIRVPNGKKVQLRLRAYSKVNAGGKILHEGLSKPLDLKGKPVTVSMTMNLSVSILASSTPIFRGASINLAGFVSGSTPPATSPLIWSATDASGATATPPNVTDSYGGLVTWIAPDSPGAYIIYAEVDRTVNKSQEAGIKASANITVINQDPYVAASSKLPLIANVGSTVDYYTYLTIADHDASDTLTFDTTSLPAWVIITPSASKNPLSLDIRLSPTVDVAPRVYAFTLRVSDGFGGSVSGEVKVTVAPSGPTNISSANKNNTPCNTVWTAGGSPYIIESPVTIDTGCKLQIDGGATVLFNKGKIISVNGTLNVLGTSPLPVSFDSYTAPSNWERIEYLEGSSGTMQFAQISFAGVGTKPTTDSALFIASNINLYSVFMVGSKSKGIFFASGTSTASDLAIIGTTSNPIYINDSFITTPGNAVDVSITGNNYISNTASVSTILVTGANATAAISGFETDGGNRGITIDNGATASIKNNAFHSAIDAGIALSIGANPTGKVVLQDNIISGNANVGISVVKAGLGSLIQSNIIRGNTKGGIDIQASQAQPIDIYNNLIVENQGSGITVRSPAVTQVNIFNNTVADNYSALATGAGLYLGASALVTAENNIFASNATTITLPSTPQDIYTAGAALTTNNNIATDASLTGINFSAAPTFIAGWYLTDGFNFAGIATTPSPSGINNGSALFSNFPFLSPTSPTPPYLYAQAATSDAGTTVDLGYHQAQVAVPVTQASIQSVVDINANTSRVIFALSDASNNVVLQPEKLTISIQSGVPSAPTIISPVYQVGQGLYAVDIDHTGITALTKSVTFQVVLPYLANPFTFTGVTY